MSGEQIIDMNEKKNVSSEYKSSGYSVSEVRYLERLHKLYFDVFNTRLCKSVCSTV